jgi:hypothetical protein
MHGLTNLKIHLNLVLKLRMNGATPHLPLYAFQASTGKTMEMFLQNLSLQNNLHCILTLFPVIKNTSLTILPASSADCLEIWEPQLPGNLRACPGL